jgi:hypothetical protein
MGRACGTYGDNGYIRDQSLKESDQFEDVLVGEMILLKSRMGGRGLYSCDSG